MQLRHAALTVTLGLAAIAWAVTVWQMNAMDMSPATTPGSLAMFIAMWMPMMAAMMLPAAVPAVMAHVQAGGRLSGVPLFLGSYLAVWALAGATVYVLYPHGPVAAGVVVIAAGVYEFTPLKQYFRTHCQNCVHSGLRFGLYCVGSCIGLMLVMVALGLMSLTWMCVISLLVLAQKLLPAKAAIDLPVAVAIVGLGLSIATAPAPVPGPPPTHVVDHTSHH